MAILKRCLLLLLLSLIQANKLYNNLHQSPLQWQFKVLPTKCNFGGDRSCGQAKLQCKECPLNNGRTILFDGYEGNTYLFNPFHWAGDNGTWFYVTNNGPSRRLAFAMTSLNNDVAILHGGYSRSSFKALSDTWLFDFPSQKWSKLVDMAVSPPGRAYHTMAPMNRDINTVLMYGGSDDAFQQFSHTWTFQQTIGWKMVDVQKIHPSPRTYHNMVQINTNQVLLFGGIAALGSEKIGPKQDDSWIYDAIKGWNKLESTIHPTARSGHAMAGYGDGSPVLLNGGSGVQNTLFGDTWTFYNGNWKQVIKVSAAIGRLQFSMMTSISPSTVLLYGGTQAGSEPNSETWYWSFQSETWFNLEHATLRPINRVYHSMTRLLTDHVIMFGGQKCITQSCHVSEALSDTWVWSDGTGWEKWFDKDTSPPSARYMHSLAYVSEEKVLMFGGTNLINGISHKFQDTWLFETSPSAFQQQKTGWTQLSGNAESMPTARSGHVMASIGRGRVIVHGGVSSTNTFLQDLWLYEDEKQIASTSSTIWKKQNPKSPPSARSYHGIANLGDAALIFGGLAASYIRLDETWIYSSHLLPSGAEIGNWTELTKLNIAPSARIFHSMASIGNGKVVLYGGTDQMNIALDDSWLFHSSDTWIQLNAPMSPRNSFGMAFLKSSGLYSIFNTNRVIFFGGLVNYQQGYRLKSEVGSDTWAIDDGCPNGKAGPECIPCPVGTYKDNNTIHACQTCPFGTTTGSIGSNSPNDCVLCSNSTKYGVCTVDLAENHFQEWRCIGGAWGSECTRHCPGGFEFACNAHGTCSTGVNGTGTCNCYFFYTLTTDCAFPWMLVVLILLSAAVIAIIVFVCRRSRIGKAKSKEQLELTQSLLNHSRIEIDAQTRKIREPLDDNEKQKLLLHLDSLATIPTTNGVGRFIGTRELVTGVVEEATAGLSNYMCIDKAKVQTIMKNGEQAIITEIHQLGDMEVIGMLNYILNEPCSEKSYPNGIRDKGRSPTMHLIDFVNDENAVGAGLERAHVIALRLYTTLAYKSINDPLRDRSRFRKKEPHSLPATVLFIREAIKKLRAIANRDRTNNRNSQAGQKEQEEQTEQKEQKEQKVGKTKLSGGNKSMVLWRGLKSTHLSSRFKQEGGTELAPMSTTSNIDVAIKYGTCTAGSVIFKIQVPDAMASGADLSWVTAFPGEAEVLYPPLTFLRPTGRIQTVKSWVSGAEVTVVELIPDLSAE